MQSLKLTLRACSSEVILGKKDWRMINKFVNELDIALKTLSYKKSGTDRDYPADRESNDVNLSESERKLSEALMRVNLAGEVAAQALYRGQAMVCKDSLQTIACPL